MFRRRLSGLERDPGRHRIDHLVNDWYIEFNQMLTTWSISAAAANGGVTLDDKRKRLLDAALEQFAEYGYEAASTNRIIQLAGISKGMLFHYFSNKKLLYAAVIDQGLERIAAFMDHELPGLTGDLFDRIVGVGLAKLRFYLREPATYKLLIDAFASHAPEEVRDIIAERRRRMAEHLSVRPEDLDLSRLRDGVDPTIAFDLVTGVVNMLCNRFIERHRGEADRGLGRMEAFVGELQSYLRLIASGIYES